MRLADSTSSEALGSVLAGVLAVGDVVALHGRLGAGKTTLARGLLRGLGFAGDVASPSFPIIQVYEPPEVRLPLWHVDLYRIADPSELQELGLDDARSEAALVIEWAERLGGFLWADSLRLTLEDDGDEGRRLTALAPPAWETRWPPR